MKKKTPAKRISGQTKNKETVKKIQTVPAVPKAKTTKKEGVKKVKPKTKEKNKAKTEVKKNTTGKSSKPAKTVSATVEGKTPSGKIKGIEIKKPAEKSKRKPKVKKKAGEIAAKAVTKYVRKKVKKTDTKKSTKISGRKIKSVVKKGDSYHVKPTIPQEILPSEYGENDITLMPVDPYKLFVFWEIREDAIERYEGELTIRIYEVGGVDNTRFDIKVSSRIGKRYIDVCPARVFVADVGIMHEGIFIAVASSRKVSTPGADIQLKSESLQKPHEPGIRIGY